MAGHIYFVLSITTIVVNNVSIIVRWTGLSRSQFWTSSLLFSVNGVALFAGVLVWDTAVLKLFRLARSLRQARQESPTEREPSVSEYSRAHRFPPKDIQDKRSSTSTGSVVSVSVVSSAGASCATTGRVSIGTKVTEVVVRFRLMMIFGNIAALLVLPFVILVAVQRAKNDRDFQYVDPDEDVYNGDMIFITGELIALTAMLWFSWLSSPRYRASTGSTSGYEVSLSSRSGNPFVAGSPGKRRSLHSTSQRKTRVDGRASALKYFAQNSSGNDALAISGSNDAQNSSSSDAVNVGSSAPEAEDLQPAPDELPPSQQRYEDTELVVSVQ